MAARRSRASAVAAALALSAMLQTLQKRAESEITDGLGKLRPEESAIVALLQQRSKREVEAEA